MFWIFFGPNYDYRKIQTPRVITEMEVAIIEFSVKMSSMQKRVESTTNFYIRRVYVFTWEFTKLREQLATNLTTYTNVSEKEHKILYIFQSSGIYCKLL